MSEQPGQNPQQQAQPQPGQPDPNCIFCKIIDGSQEAKKVYEDDKVLCALDINPAAKGHMLLMPKGHYPIMPLIPPDVFIHLFHKAREMAYAARQGLAAVGTTVFIANGAAAGQQSAHFMLHIVPREKHDSLSNFDIPHNEIDQSDIKDALKNNLNVMMMNHYKRLGKKPPTDTPEKPATAKPIPPSTPTTPTQTTQPISIDEKKKRLMVLFEQKPEFKEALINHTEEFKKTISASPQLKAVFEGVDLDKLADEIRGGKQPGKKEKKKTKEESQDQKEEGKKEPEENEDADLDSIVGLFK
ncbi:HIT family protein [Nanoarchaeota archaeon]